VRRPEHGAFHGERGDPLVGLLRDPEVEDLHRFAARARDEEDVVGLQIAVNHAVFVRRVERFEELLAHLERLFFAEPTSALDALRKRLAGEALHHEERNAALGLIEIEDLDDAAARTSQLGCPSRSNEEASGYTDARISPFVGVTRAELEADGYANGSSRELAGRGLYGDYALFFPAEVLSRDGSDGLDLDRVTDVLLRLEYVSVAR
jgi:hypothetical protein